MKRSLYIFISILFLIGCEDEKVEPTVEYIDLQWIWLGEETTYNCEDISWCDEETYPGNHRDAYVYYRGDKPSIPSSFFNNDVSWVSSWKYKSKWIHYYKDDGYIEFQEIGEEQLDSKDVADYLIEYKAK